eukprot:34855-Eustigmatos_ZCMA.PRE.1
MAATAQEGHQRGEQAHDRSVLITSHVWPHVSWDLCFLRKGLSSLEKVIIFHRQTWIAHGR